MSAGFWVADPVHARHVFGVSAGAWG